MDGELARLPSDEEFAVESAKLDADGVKLKELRSDIGRLHLRDGDPVEPVVRFANLVVGFTDELGRLLAALVIADVGTVALTMVSPWFWIGAGVALGYTIVVLAWLARRRAHARSAALKALDR